MKMNRFLLCMAAMALILSLLCAACADGTWICPTCGKENPERANFCGSCRTQRPSADNPVVITRFNGWVCPACNSVNAEDNSFCMICGGDHHATDQPALLTEDVRMTTLSLDPVRIDEIPGKMKDKGEEHVVSLTPQVSGLYRFWVRKADNGFSLHLSILDSSKNSLGNFYIEQGEGGSVRLTAGREYYLHIQQYHSLGDYVVAIGNPRECVPLGANQIIEDSVSFRDQINQYSLTAPLTGTYRFWIAQISNGVSLHFTVTDEGGYNVSNGYLEQNEGISASLKAGETYTFLVTQYNGYDSYTIKIGVPQPAIDISGCEAIGDRMYFRDQDNVYTITPSESGKYTFTLKKADKDVSIQMKLIDEGGYILTSGYCEQGERISADLKAGLKYTLHLIRYNYNGEYTLTVTGP